VNGAVVIVAAVGASAVLLAAWSWGLDRVVERQQHREAERLYRERREPPVLGGAPRPRRSTGHGR
jgi:hypothetical protein